MPYKTVAALDRLGTESAFEVLARAQALAAQGKSIISLSIGQPDFPTPPHIVEAAVKALRDGQHGYTAANGILALREAIAADLNRRHGVTVNPGQIVAVPGGKVTMAFAVMLFGEPGAEILFPDPGFPIYRSLIDWTGAKGVPVPLYEKDGFAFTAEAALSRLTDKTRLMIFNTPANPTGGVTPKEELDKLIKGLERFPNVAIMADEIYSEMLYDGLQHHSLLRYTEIADRVILLDGFSKTYAMTGWRLGYGVWPGKLAEAATRLAININSCVNAATQFAGIAALTGPRGDIDAMMVAFDKRRRLVHRELNAMPGFSCILPKGAFYAFPNIAKTGMSAKEMERGLLEEAGVASIAGTSFGAEGEGFLRVSYANSESNILEACGRIRAFLGNRPK